MSTSSNIIRVYTDAGAALSCVEKTLEMFKTEYPSFIVKEIKSEELINTDWASSTYLLVFPGGNDLDYDRKLHGNGASIIKRYVENGGKYFGICAGCYFACSAFEFRKGEVDEISRKRELAFFPGIATGPLFNTTYVDGGETGAVIVNVKFNMNDKTSNSHSTPNEIPNNVMLYYNGGCAFEERGEVFETSKNSYEIVSKYDGDINAVVRCNCGLGKAVLCSPHLEFDTEECSILGHKTSSDFDVERKKFIHFVLDPLLN
ncbi:hypothetical protein QTN25_003755 [Entamoeba marina]